MNEESVKLIGFLMGTTVCVSLVVWIILDGIPGVLSLFIRPKQTVLLAGLPVISVKREGRWTIVELLGWDDIRINCSMEKHRIIVAEAEHQMDDAQYVTWIKGLVEFDARKLK